MNADQIIDKENNLIYRRCKGEITIEDIFEEIQKSFASKNFEKNMNSIWDFRLANINIDKSDLKELYPALKIIENKRGNKYKVAILISKNEYTISSIHLALSRFNNMPFETSVFRYKEEVLQWLNLEPEKINYI